MKTITTNKAGQKVVYHYDYCSLGIADVADEMKRIKRHCKKSGITLSEFLGPIIKKAAKNLA